MNQDSMVIPSLDRNITNIQMADLSLLGYLILYLSNQLQKSFPKLT